MYGDDAELAAAKRADEALDQGDVDGERLWKRIKSAVSELTRQIALPGEPRH
jgi:hypothetical protein